MALVRLISSLLLDSEEDNVVSIKSPALKRNLEGMVEDRIYFADTLLLDFSQCVMNR